MCGIIGQFAFGELDEEEEKTRQESMIFLGSELLQLTQERGKDATGMSLLFEDGNYLGLKMGITPIEFIARFGKNEKEYGGVVKVWRKNKKPVKVFLGHCRKTSKGSAMNNKNNHPIRVGEIIGVHNGTLENDDVVFKNLGCGRDGQVDSEAIFRLLNHFSKNGAEPFTTDMMAEVVQRIDGTFAVFAMSGNNPYQVCGFRDRKPIDFALIRPLKLVVASSEKKFIETAVFRYNKYISLYMPDAKFPILKKGDIDYELFTDDSGFVFDLRQKVTPKTIVKDLYESDKMPRAKLDGYEKQSITNNWSKAANSKASNAKATGAAGQGTSSTLKKEVTKSADSSAAKSTGKNQQGAGRIWSRKARRYICNLDASEVERDQERGNVQVDLSSGKIKEIKNSDGDNSEFALELDKDTENKLVVGQATIEELSPAETVAVELLDEDVTAHTVEVDVTVDADAIEKAEAMVKNEQLFDNTIEVSEALEIEDAKTLEALPVTALANRLKKFILKTGFAKGYSARKNEEHDGDKFLGAEKLIRNLKTMVHMYENIFKLSGMGVRSSVVDRAVTEAFESGADLDEKSLDKIFKPGDERGSRILPLVKRMVANKGNR